MLHRRPHCLPSNQDVRSDSLQVRPVPLHRSLRRHRREEMQPIAINFIASSLRSSLRSPTTTDHPSLRNRSAAARPMPPPPPVTIATWQHVATCVHLLSLSFDARQLLPAQARYSPQTYEGVLRELSLDWRFSTRRLSNFSCAIP